MRSAFIATVTLSLLGSAAHAACPSDKLVLKCDATYLDGARPAGTDSASAPLADTESDEPSLSNCEARAYLTLGKTVFNIHGVVAANSAFLVDAMAIQHGADSSVAPTYSQQVNSSGWLDNQVELPVIQLTQPEGQVNGAAISCVVLR
jgi:hypothetical protein